MPISCLSPRLKQLILETMQRESPIPQLMEKIFELPDCAGGIPVEFKGCPAGGGKGKKAKGEGRPRSEYQEHISKCMKARNIHSFDDAPAAMKACAAQWKQIKAQRGQA